LHCGKKRCLTLMFRPSSFFRKLDTLGAASSRPAACRGERRCAVSRQCT
jgi:hypothetical protein